MICSSFTNRFDGGVHCHTHDENVPYRFIQVSIILGQSPPPRHLPIGQKNQGKSSRDNWPVTGINSFSLKSDSCNIFFSNPTSLTTYIMLFHPTLLHIVFLFNADVASGSSIDVYVTKNAVEFVSNTRGNIYGRLS